ncbi:MAG: hypothetical protein RBS07_13410 [Lentimicrobium sp.]|nr:hypothetical protein [Lentimicrobium sp.]
MKRNWGYDGEEGNETPKGFTYSIRVTIPAQQTKRQVLNLIHRVGQAGFLSQEI